MVPVEGIGECHATWDCWSMSHCRRQCSERHNGVGMCIPIPPPGIPTQCYCTWQY